VGARGAKASLCSIFLYPSALIFVVVLLTTRSYVHVNHWWQGALRPEVGRFLKDLHHSLVFGNWLSPTLDYDDHLNYLWWAAALAAVQVWICLFV